jgi:hypothetical protein
MQVTNIDNIIESLSLHVYTLTLTNMVFHHSHLQIRYLDVHRFGHHRFGGRCMPISRFGRCIRPVSVWPNPCGIGRGRESSPSTIWSGDNRMWSIVDLVTTDSADDVSLFVGFGGVPWKKCSLSTFWESISRIFTWFSFLNLYWAKKKLFSMFYTSYVPSDTRNFVWKSFGEKTHRFHVRFTIKRHETLRRCLVVLIDTDWLFDLLTTSKTSPISFMINRTSPDYTSSDRRVDCLFLFPSLPPSVVCGLRVQVVQYPSDTQIEDLCISIGVISVWWKTKD